MISFMKGGCIQAFLGYVGKVVGILERDWTLELEDPVANPQGPASELGLRHSQWQARLAHFTAGLLGEANRAEDIAQPGHLGPMDIGQWHKQNWFPLQELRFFQKTEAL